jgi:hypothetical protein
MNYLELIPLHINILIIITLIVSTSYGLYIKNINYTNHRVSERKDFLENLVPELENFNFGLSPLKKILYEEDRIYTVIFFFFSVILFFYKWYFPLIFFSLSIVSALLNGVIRIIVIKIIPSYCEENEVIGKLKYITFFLECYIVVFLLNNLKSIEIFNHNISVLILFLFFSIYLLLDFFYKTKRLK